MIQNLSVSNIAIIENSELGFEPGLSVLTGETGAGKSLLVDSINLAMGERADFELVRTGAKKGQVSLKFGPIPNQTYAILVENDLEGTSDSLEISRELLPSGRSNIRVNGKSVPLGILKKIGMTIVDLHGQHDHQALIVPERQIEFLDSWIGADAARILCQVSTIYEQVEILKRKLHNVQRSQRERELRRSMLEFQIGEIEEAKLQPGILDEIQLQFERIQNSERLALGAGNLLEILSESESSVIVQLGMALKELRTMANLDSELESAAADLDSTLTNIQDFTREIGQYSDNLDSDPKEIEILAGRIDQIRTLFRKYGKDEGEVLAFLDECRNELEELQDPSSNESELRAQLDVLAQQLELHAKSLSDLRKAKALEFAQLVTDCARDLAMDAVQFSVDFQEKQIAPDGRDIITFLFSANEGEDQKTLAKIASGGEISRLMLAIKVAGSGRAGVPTLIFDEVDTGLSGRAAVATANKMLQLAKDYQIIAISHLPQIAAKAQHHYRIDKVIQNGRTITQVRKLNDEERIEEIARMLAGESVGDKARQNAAELLGFGFVS